MKKKKKQQDYFIYHYRSCGSVDGLSIDMDDYGIIQNK